MPVKNGFFAGWLSGIGSALSLAGLSGPRGGLPGWLGKTGSIGIPNVNPTISTISSIRHELNATITGANFGVSQGTLTIGGVTQSITSWSDTSIAFVVDRGQNKYGSTPLVITTTGALFVSTLVTLDHTYAGQWVTLTSPLAPLGNRLTATPDVIPGDIIAWGGITGSGTVTVLPDASFEADSTVTSFWFEVWDSTTADLTKWGPRATQSFTIDPTLLVSSAKLGDVWREISYPAVKVLGVWKNAYAAYVKKAGVWSKVFPATNIAPTVSISSHKTGDTISGSTTVRVVAVDDVGISNVSLYIGYPGNSSPPVLLGSSTISPLVVTFNASAYPSAGGYQLYATATDVNGLTTTSSIVTVTVATNFPPAVVITSPPNGDVVYTNYTIAASVTDANPGDTITQVEFFENGVSLGVDTTAPYSYSIPIAGKQNGSYTYTATATDNGGAKGTSLPITLNVYVYAAPVLSSPLRTGPTWDAATSTYYANWSVNTTGTNGSLYWVLSSSPVAPTATQIILGRDSTGLAAFRQGVLAVTQPGSKSFTTTNLPFGTTLYMYWAHEDAREQVSNVVTANVTTPAQITITVDRTLATGVGTVTAPAGVLRSVSATTAYVVYTIAGATGTPTISFTQLSGTPATVTHEPVNSRFRFTRTTSVEVPGTVSLTGTYRMNVLDQAGRSAVSPIVTVTTTHNANDDGSIPL